MNPTPVMTAQMLARLQPFAGIAGQQLDGLLSLCHQERFSQSIDPFRQRDWRGQVVYLTRGELKVTQPDGVIRVLVGGTGRALFPVVEAGQVPIRARAITDVELLRLDERAVDLALTWDQCLPKSDSADSVAQDGPPRAALLALAASTGAAFGRLPAANIASLLERFERVTLHAGDVVVREGVAGDYFYLIESGRCRVTRGGMTGADALAELTAGDAFGEEALLAGMPRNATVSMLTAGVLLRLSQADFNTLLHEPLLQRCTPAEAVQRVAGGSCWLDVRTSAEYRHDGLARACNIPLPALRNALDALDREIEYVVYCQSGRRSAAAAFLMMQRGFRVVLLDGGLHALSLAESERKIS